MIYLSLLYPLMVLIITWALSVFVLIAVGPVLARTMVEFDVAGPWVVSLYDSAAKHANWIGPLLPTLFAIWLWSAWFRAGRIARGAELHPLLGFGAIGTLTRLQRASRLATLSDLLALLIGNSVPLAEAVELASSAIGSPAFAMGGKALAQRLARGETIPESPAGFPPLITWTITASRSQPQMVRSLRRAADVYRDEATRRSQWLMVYVPLVATIGICGGLVLAYAALTLGPWLALLYRVSLPY
jgi:type II secretory pathway component PulF